MFHEILLMSFEEHLLQCDHMSEFQCQLSKGSQVMNSSRISAALFLTGENSALSKAVATWHWVGQGDEKFDLLQDDTKSESSLAKWENGCAAAQTTAGCGTTSILAAAIGL